MSGVKYRERGFGDITNGVVIAAAYTTIQREN
jgi:hypothetical protein